MIATREMEPHMQPSSFTQFSHTTSFLPFTMALIAAVSRLRLLLFELDDGVREAWRAVHRLYSGINVRAIPFS